MTDKIIVSGLTQPKIRNHEDGVYYGQAGYIETFTGQHFYPDDPVFVAEDISHALSLCCRYNGHCGVFYSVAEHCALVASLMQEEVGGDPLEGIMHDALEAYLTDVPSPFKQFLPDYKAFDDKLETALRAQFGLPDKKTEECKKADWLALFIEAYYLLPSKGEAFPDPNDIRPEALALIDEKGWRVNALPPHLAEEVWLTVFDKFTNGLRHLAGEAN